jgi:hypothetical protein
LDATLSSARDFLQKAKRLVSEGKYKLGGGREGQNKNFREKYELTEKDCITIMYNLYPSHREKGPEEDESFGHSAGTIFTFTKTVSTDGFDIDVYVKLKIPDGEDFLFILSFHEAMF